MENKALRPVPVEILYRYQVRRIGRDHAVKGTAHFAWTCTLAEVRAIFRQAPRHTFYVIDFEGQRRSSDLRTWEATAIERPPAQNLLALCREAARRGELL